MKVLILYAAILIRLAGYSQSPVFYKEKYRPQFHFTPPINWMNDPNGLVYFAGEYHLFYQFNPFGNKWGHMSWGHAVSKDLVYWQPLPVAIGEEKDTMIFSGSCVVDSLNTGGFAKEEGQLPMVAVFTGHIEGQSQSQQLAYSLDKGRTWTRYNKNPVLDLHKKDFRDPSVFWYAKEKKWVMSVMLPIEHQLQLYSSPDLKRWDLMSQFGPAGDTSGVWECPDLFEAPVESGQGKTKWVFMHSPAPYMQYFIGEFDGHSFSSENPANKILRPDYGADYYAAIVYKNLPAGRSPVSIGWVNNWNYAVDIPTSPWKSAMSLPRQLSVKKINNEWILIQQPVEGIKKLRNKLSSWSNVQVTGNHLLPVHSQAFELEVTIDAENFSSGSSGVRIAKGMGHYFEIGYDPAKQVIYTDRAKAGDTGFHPAFAKLHRYEAPARVIDGKIVLDIFFDKSIVEVFINGGEAVMTSQVFPNEKDDNVELFSNGRKTSFGSVKCWTMRSVW